MFSMYALAALRTEYPFQPLRVLAVRQPASVVVAQYTVQNLLGRSLWEFRHVPQAVDNHNSFGLFEPGQRLCAKFEQVTFIGGTSILQAGKRTNLLAQNGVVHSDNGGLGNVGVLGKHIFNFRRVDFLSALDDQVILAAAEVVVPILVPQTEVASVVPVIAEPVLLQFWKLVVSDGNIGAADADFALGFVRDLCVGFVHYLH